MDPLTSSDPAALGPVRLLGRLGSGGMGQVYLGVTEDGDRVAVKVIRAASNQNPDLHARFAREVQAMGMVQGPSTASLLAHSGPEETDPWLAMEYVPGLNLSEFVKRDAPLAPIDVTVLALLLAEALADIHRAGLLHRDLKPGNVVLGPRGPQVIDFGLAAIGAPGSELTHSDRPLGTPSCMAPEQVGAPKEVTAAADVYGLGATLLFAVTGHYPYHGATREAVYLAVLSPDLAPDLDGTPDELRPLLTALLAQDPAGRPELDALRAQLTQRLATSGLSVSAARNRLAARTYVPGTGDDSLPTPVPTTRPLPSSPRPVSTTQAAPALRDAATRLRRAYARTSAW